MFNVLTLNNIATMGLQEFPQHLYHVADNIKNPDAVLLRSFDMHSYNITKSVQVIGRAGAGVNNIPVVDLTKRGVPVLNTPGANANAVCELVIAGMLLASRHIFSAIHYVKNLQASEEELDAMIERNKKQFAGVEILGKTLGVIGLGSIGVKVANAAQALGMKVIGYDPKISINRAWELSARVRHAKRLEELLSQSDYISIHVPLIPDTNNMIREPQFALMRPHAVLLNFARDGIVDNEALAQALQQKKIFRYVSDFPSAALKDSPAVISLPHLGASTREAEENCAMMIVKQVREFLEYGAIGTSVNFPSVDVAPQNENYRLSIVNANIPNMVAQISSCLAKASLNIVSLVNKSKADIAYTLIDLEKNIDAATLQCICEVEGIIQVRQLPPTIV